MTAAKRQGAAIATALLLPLFLAPGAVAVAGEGADSYRETRIVSPDVVGGDLYGSAVSIDGRTLAVTAPSDDGLDDNAGSVFVFERDLLDATAWAQTAQLLAEDGGFLDQLGNAVSISGGTVLAGAMEADDEAGSAYVFERGAGDPGTWVQAARLKGHDTVFGDSFGVSVSVAGDTALVGAHRDDDFGPNTGAVYMFERDPGGPIRWVESAKLLAADAAAFEEFGRAVAIDGDLAVVGSLRAVYIFFRPPGDPTAWLQVAELTPFDGRSDNDFGSSVAISGHTVVVGTPLDSDAGHEAGAAYVYEGDPADLRRWTGTAKLIGSDTESHDELGTAVAIDGSTALVGAPREDDPVGLQTGAAYVFERDPDDPTTWIQAAKLVPDERETQDFLGQTVSISRGTALVGSWTAGPAGEAWAYLPIAQPEFAFDGSCPGEITLELTGATPGGAVLFARGADEGVTVVPARHCGEIELGLENAEPFAAGLADAEGARSITRVVPEGSCGTLLQAVDLGSCGVGVVSRVP